MIIIYSNCFSQGSIKNAFYNFEDNVYEVVPFWKELNYQDSLIVKESEFIYKSEYRTTLKYFDTLGFMYKTEQWIENRKKSKAYLVNHSDYTIKFDSIQGFQVKTGHNNLNHYYYDSTKFNKDGALEFRYKLDIRNMNGSTWDTTSLLNIKLISQDDDLRKYEIQNGSGTNSISIYNNDRPVFFVRNSYSDTITYYDHDDYTIVNYYFKNLGDTMYQIGERDSLRNGLIHSKQIFERYQSSNYKMENYFYDKDKRLVMKSSPRNRISLEVHVYNGYPGYYSYKIDSGHILNTQYWNYKEFPFKEWRLTTSEKYK